MIVSEIQIQNIDSQIQIKIYCLIYSEIFNLTLFLFNTAIEDQIHFNRIKTSIKMLIDKNSLRMNKTWTNRDLTVIGKFKSRLHQMQQQQVKSKILNRQSNTINFYTITPKEQLPKYLQKFKFQTLHLKQKELTKTIKIFKNQYKRPQQRVVRKKLKSNNANGEILFLSEIYQNLEEGKDKFFVQQQNSNKFAIGDLEAWDKKRLENQNEQLPKELIYNSGKRSPGQRRSASKLAVQNPDYENKSRISNNMEKYNVKKFKDGANYKAQMEKSLEIIEMSHSQSNMMNKFVFIENSSKILLQELDAKKYQVEKQIKLKTEMLQKKLKEHHQIFQQRAIFLNENRKSEQSKEQKTAKPTHSVNYFPKIESKILQTEQKAQQRKQKLDQIQGKVGFIKKQIEAYENSIVKLNEQIKSIHEANEVYFKISLRNGIDCRQSGLGWIIKRMRQISMPLENLTFPSYMDKKSKNFITQKVELQSALEALIQTKRQFVNEIGKQNSYQTKNGISCIDCIDQNQTKRASKNGLINNISCLSANVPLKYRKSKKKLSILQQEYATNHQLLELKQRKGLQISSDLDGLTGKQIYQKTKQRIKKINFNKLKREKNNRKNAKLIEYQNILEKIKDMHIQIEELDIQQENYLLSNYYDQRDLFFMQNAACFGSKKAYSMIIKNFSLKNAFGH